MESKSNLKTVLFVCLENSCRSQIAEAFAVIYGKDVLKAYSAGSTPSGLVNPRGIEAMKDFDYDLSSHQSKSLEEIPDKEYEWAISMGCGDFCPNVRAKNREDWKLPNPAKLEGEEFNTIRNLIEIRVKQLVEKCSNR